ncbi:MAG: hypothetical protein WBQ79_12955 [Acidobacteriaceae bacterium]
MNTVQRTLLRAGCGLASALLSILCFTASSVAWADNPQIAGSGCVDANSSSQLGETPDYLSSRKFVSIGVSQSTAMLYKLRHVGHSATLEEFLSPEGVTSAQLGTQFVLLVGHHHLISTDPTEAAAIIRARANGVPIVVEDFDQSEFKSLTGLSLGSSAAVVQFAPGGRAQTITLIRRPKQGHTDESALNNVNRAIDKHTHALLGATLDPTRQAYAENIWTVWLHTGNVVCTPPWYSAQQQDYPQTGNLDFGVQMTLVAEKQPLEKAINLQYLGTGFSPLAPGVLTIDYNPYFKGALTLSTSYEGALTARYGAMLTGTANTVQPNAVIGAHVVTKTNGFSWGLNSSCGANKSGPGCSIGASFSFTSETQKTRTITARTIDASSSLGQVSDPNGTICGDPQNGCWQANHNIHYYLSSTSSGSGGQAINLKNNDWYGFFDTSSLEPIHQTRYGDAVNYPCSGCSLTNPPSPPPATVNNWPQWAFSSALTEGEAGYTFAPTYTGDLTLTAKAAGKEGIFSLGTGPKEGRLPNGYGVNCIAGQCQTALDYVLDLYTDAATVSKTINIDANQVNYSGMPTCAMRQYTQADLGIYQILNQTNHPLNISQMNAAPFSPTPISTVADDYRGTADYVLGVSATTVQPGQYQYIALCSSNQGTSPALQLLYSNGSRASGTLVFNGSGQPVSYNTAQVKYTAGSRLFTIF